MAQRVTKQHRMACPLVVPYSCPHGLCNLDTIRPVGGQGDCNAPHSEVLRQERFDALVTDLLMPNLDGMSLCETIRAEMPDAVSIILVITGRSDPELRERASRLERTEFLEKPVSLQSLAERLRHHLMTVDDPA